VKPFTVIEILRPAREAGFERKREPPPGIAAELFVLFRMVAKFASITPE
jgi:hypothetical protein